jgi:hypothetical protein
MSQNSPSCTISTGRSSFAGTFAAGVASSIAVGTLKKQRLLSNKKILTNKQTKNIFKQTNKIFFSIKQRKKDNFKNSGSRLV